MKRKQAGTGQSKKSNLKKIKFSESELNNLREQPIKEMKELLTDLGNWRRDSLSSQFRFV